jgi:Mg-chelatase subunit ChlD
MEQAAAALAGGSLAADAQALLDKTKIQQRKIEQVCGVLFSEKDGKQPDGVHVTVLVDCSGSMYQERIANARKALRALLTSLDPTSTFSVYLFGSSCRAVDVEGSRVIAASPENIRTVTCEVDDTRSMGGTELFDAVQEVMRLQVPSSRRHNVMILTDGEVGQTESEQVKALLAPLCPHSALVGIIGIGNDVTRTTLRHIVEGGLGPQALLVDDESEDGVFFHSVFKACTESLLVRAHDAIMRFFHSMTALCSPLRI